MELSPYIDTVQRGLTDAAALADEPTRQVASRLGTALESSTRLALIQALSDAAGRISADLAPSSVELRMAGADPEFVVSQAAEPSSTVMIPAPAAAEAEPNPEPTEPDAEDEPVARISLRLPQSVKAKVDEVAAAEGISTNAWLIRAVMDTLASRGGHHGEWQQPPRPAAPPAPPAWGPFGPEGVFGPNGVFGPEGPFGAGRSERVRHREGGSRRGSVQGWVR